MKPPFLNKDFWLIVIPECLSRESRFFVLFSFFLTTVNFNLLVHADNIYLPKPGIRVNLSPEFHPTVLKGITVDPNNPFKFDFILDKGDRQPGDIVSLGAINAPIQSVSPQPEADQPLAESNNTLPSERRMQSRATQGTNRAPNENYLKQESQKLIKYFLTAITTPDNDLWVNLSPYEKNRIIPDSFGQTDMGRDLLAQDYLLKQITATLMYPEDKLGKRFWKRIYDEAAKKFGTTNIPVNTFNKVWIVPDKAKVYEHGNTAFIVNSRLKVMLEQDYLAVEKDLRQSGDMFQSEQQNVSPSSLPSNGALKLKATQGTYGSRNQSSKTAWQKQIIKEIIIPELEKEVNEGKNFAPLRQVYQSLILAVWFKKHMKNSLLGQKYVNQNKVNGIRRQPGDIVSLGAINAPIESVSPSRSQSKELLNLKGKAVTSQVNNPDDIELIYQRYLTAFKKGVYHYIKEEKDPISQQSIPRKYFSGGAHLIDAAMTTSFFSDRSEMKKYVQGVSTALLMVSCMLQGSAESIQQTATNSIVRVEASLVVLDQEVKDFQQVLGKRQYDLLVKDSLLHQRAVSLLRGLSQEKKAFLEQIQIIGDAQSILDVLNYVAETGIDDLRIQFQEMRDFFRNTGMVPFSKSMMNRVKEVQEGFGEDWLNNLANKHSFLFDIRGNLAGQNLEQAKDFLRALKPVQGKGSQEDIELLRLHHLGVIAVYANLYPIAEDRLREIILNGIFNPVINNQREYNADSDFEYSSMIFKTSKENSVGIVAHELAHNYLVLGGHDLGFRAVGELVSDLLALGLLQEVYGAEKADNYFKFIGPYFKERPMKGVELLRVLGNPLEKQIYVAGKMLLMDEHFWARKIIVELMQRYKGKPDFHRIAVGLLSIDNELSVDPSAIDKYVRIDQKTKTFDMSELLKAVILDVEGESVNLTLKTYRISAQGLILNPKSPSKGESVTIIYPNLNSRSAAINKKDQAMVIEMQKLTEMEQRIREQVYRAQDYVYGAYVHWMIKRSPDQLDNLQENNNGDTLQERLWTIIKELNVKMNPSIYLTKVDFLNKESVDSLKGKFLIVSTEENYYVLDADGIQITDSTITAQALDPQTFTETVQITISLQPRMTFKVLPKRIKAYTSKDFEIDGQGFLIRGRIYLPEFIQRERAISETRKTIAFDLDETLAYFNRESSMYQLRPGIEGQLRQLKDQGYRLVLWTAAKKNHVREKFINFFPELAELFDLVLTREDWGISENDYDELLKIYSQFFNEDVNRILDTYAYTINAYGVKDIVLLKYSLLVDDNPLMKDLEQSYPLTGKFRVFNVSFFEGNVHNYSRGSYSYPDRDIPTEQFAIHITSRLQDSAMATPGGVDKSGESAPELKERGLLRNDLIGDENQVQAPKPSGKSSLNVEKVSLYIGNRENRPELVDIKKRIFDKFTFIAFDMFMDKLNKSVERFNQKIRQRDQPYAVLWDYKAHSSRRWVYTLAKSKLQTLPSVASYFQGGSEDKTQVLRKMIDQGISHFVIFDDASYTGSQISQTIKQVVSLCRKWGKSLPTFTVIVPFASEVAIKEIRNSYSYPIDLIYEQVMLTLGDVLSAEEIRLLNQETGQSQIFNGSRYSLTDGMTFFDHTVADAYSLSEDFPDLIHRADKFKPYADPSTEYYRRERKEFMAYFNPENPKVGTGDSAQLSDPGGVDLTNNRINLEVDRDNGQISKPLDLKSLENIDIQGLYIKDIEIKPLINLPQLLGLSA